MAAQCPSTSTSASLMKISYRFEIRDSVNVPHVWTVVPENLNADKPAENLNAAKLLVVWTHFYKSDGCKPFDPEEFEKFLDPKKSHVPDSYSGGPMYEAAHEILYHKLGYIPQYQQGKKEQQ